MQLLLGSLIGIFLLIFLMGWSSGAPLMSEVMVTSTLYSDVVLPCKFSFVDRWSDLTVIWRKGENHQEVIVYKLQKGEEKPEEQDPRYRGRVTLSGEVSQGNLNLTLSGATFEDEGTYECRAVNPRGNGNSRVTLTIGDLNARDSTAALVTIDGKRRMKCRGSGVYRHPQVQWITAEGQDLSGYGSLSVTEQRNGRRLVESILDYDLGADVPILCHIKEGRLRKSTRAVISDGTHPVHFWWSGSR